MKEMSCLKSERDKKGIPVIIKDWQNKTNLVKVGIQPIDVR